MEKKFIKKWYFKRLWVDLLNFGCFVKIVWSQIQVVKKLILLIFKVTLVVKIGLNSLDTLESKDNFIKL